MSRESQEILDQAVLTYPAHRSAQVLQTAARGHLGASRELSELLAEYAAAMENQRTHTPEQAAAAQRIADELEPVRMAAQIVAGHLPPTGD